MIVRIYVGKGRWTHTYEGTRERIRRNGEACGLKKVWQGVSVTSQLRTRFVWWITTFVHDCNVTDSRCIRRTIQGAGYDSFCNTPVCRCVLESRRGVGEYALTSGARKKINSPRVFSGQKVVDNTQSHRERASGPYVVDW